MNDRMKNFYMTIASNCANMSRAERLQVGAVVVKNNNIVSFSWNGTPTGWDNTCETKYYMDPGAGGWLSPAQIEEDWPFEDFKGRYSLKTKPEVLHAESNAISKLARGGEAGAGSTIFITHSPCIDCAKLIYQSGIISVYYAEDYRSDAGINFLRQCGVTVEKLD